MDDLVNGGRASLGSTKATEPWGEEVNLKRSDRMTLLAFAKQEEGTRSIQNPSSPNVLAANTPQNARLILLAHELRSPLTAIRYGLQVLRQTGEDAATREKVVALLERQTEQIGCLVEDVLELSRVGLGKVLLRKQPLDLDQVVDGVVEMVRPSLEARRHALTVALPPGRTILEADPVRITQVLTNLLENAVKYTDPGGRIELAVHRETDGIVVRVRDTGIGIAPDMLNHVFDLFWQSPRGAAHAQGGLGIGLALVRELVSWHGGTVSASSAGPGCGSEFVVRLPQATPVKSLHGIRCADQNPPMGS
jgi:two-component system CheB/CheR fusion protein